MTVSAIGLDTVRITLLAISSSALCSFGVFGAEENSAPFSGQKTAWHQFDRYDFVMDEASLQITPMKAAEDEKDGISHTQAGQRRCVVVVPKTPARGNPWSWRGCYWDHQPQAEIELLKRGFHIAYIESSATFLGNIHNNREQ